MFHPTSRYAGLTTYPVVDERGRVRVATCLPLPSAPRAIGTHRRQDGQSLDLIADRFLADPHGFHRLCDASLAMSPDALAVRDTIAIPPKGR